MNFNPNLDNSSDDNTKNSIIPSNAAQVVIGGSTDILSMANMLNITLSHVEDDKKCRDEVDSITDMLNDSVPMMSIKELIDYLKAKIKEREFHVDCIFKAYNFVQRTELAKEYLIGSERKERIIEATDRTKVNKLLGMLNITTEE